MYKKSGNFTDTHGGVRLGEMTISCLLYADDLVILAENEVAMQALLKRVCDWCSLWDINVNSNKSAVIHFHHQWLINDCYFYTS